MMSLGRGKGVKTVTPKVGGGRKPQASHPRFKRAKMSVMGKSAYGPQSGGMAFPADGGAPMPPNAAPDNIVQ